MWPRSGEKMGRRSRKRRTIVKSVSKMGTPSAIIGTRRATAVEALYPLIEEVPRRNPRK